MYGKLVFICVVLVSAVLSAPPAPTSFHEISTDAANIPPDNGGNFGDNLWHDRVTGDTLLLREIRINDIKHTEADWKWTCNIPNRRITHMRFLNIGRERAYVASASSSGGSQAEAHLQIPANKQFRVLIEVYGK